MFPSLCVHLLPFSEEINNRKNKFSPQTEPQTGISAVKKRYLGLPDTVWTLEKNTRFDDKAHWYIDQKNYNTI